MIWANPEFFLFLLLIPVLAGLLFWYYKQKRFQAITFSDTSDLTNLPGNYRVYGRWAAYALNLLAILLIIIALARPQSINETVERTTEGIDIVISLDLSTSMLAEDLRPNRFIAAKNLTSEFISNRPNDRIGLVIFRRQSFTLVPPTTDYGLLNDQLLNLEMNITEDGTAIGMGIATAVNRLRNSTAESKVIILLTDGENNAGEVDPVTASDLASAHQIRLYTIGVSTEGTAPYPVNDPVFGKRYHPIKVDIDENMLTQIAEKTGGRYFRARDTEALASIYNAIDELEKSELEETIYLDRKDHYSMYLLSGILLLFLSYISRHYLFRMELT
ncbi:MAG TPA: aerotolerance regulator BatA [Bacteroidetes bacterium]|nr:aerotolerance regulator BatA [Bacteroidota bacterium]